MTSKSLISSVRELAGVGPALQKKLHALEIQTIQDLLFHLPYRYIDRTKITAIDNLQPGQDAYVQGKIELTRINFGKRRSLLCILRDETGELTLRFFNFNRYQQSYLKDDVYLRCWGQVYRRGNKLEMIHPEYKKIDSLNTDTLEKTLTPFYPATEGLTQTKLRNLTDQALVTLSGTNKLPEELIPGKLIEDMSFPSLYEALHFLHRPPPKVNLEILIQGKHPAQKRLIFEELLAHQLSLQVLRQQINTKAAYSVKNSDDIPVKKFLDILPFDLTSAQKRVEQQIYSDMTKNIPMLRLIQGDVGSGKTVIAAFAAVRAISVGLQVTLMAPTELLAEQHYYNFRNWMQKLDIEVALLTGKIRKSQRCDIIKKIESKTPLILIGTHALFQEDINFSQLGLVIIDEQHRFGVHQRLALIDKGNPLIRPHQLIMTATPIPRTLAMSLFAELDTSTIDELPPGRKPVTTLVLSNHKRHKIIERITKVCNEGGQVYWVCPLIKESDAMQCQAAEKTFEHLNQVLPHLSIGLIHGRLRTTEKERVMIDFKAEVINLLVATTVIEVGVDVPNASLMIIENAERMGLSQLHQLRGRIGRGARGSHCVLLYKSPLSEIAQKRLQVMREHSDGFVVAEKDLELRGPGDLLGTRQTGIPQMKIANLARDIIYLPRIRQIANSILTDHPSKVDKLTHRWLLNRVEYGKV